MVRHRPIFGLQPPSRSATARAFSIIELIVVIVIIAIMAGAVAPRIATLTGRATRSAAERSAQIFSAAARRDTLTSQRIALDYDAGSGVIRMLVFDDSLRDPWREDPLTPAVNLGDTVIAEVTSDSAALDAKRWRVEFPQNSPRPSLRLVLTDASGRDPWRVELSSRASRATANPGSQTQSAESLDGAIDLDASGKAAEPW